MSSRARVKRRGHVQQYSTGGQNLGDAVPASSGPTRPSPAMPRFPPAAPFAESPQNHAISNEKTDTYPNQASDTAWSHNVSAGVSPRGVSESAPVHAQNYAPYELQPEEQNDAWDEEIGDIPWEDEASQEPPKDDVAENANNCYNNAPTTATEQESQAASRIDQELDEEEDLAELPWDEEEDQDQVQGQNEQNGQDQRHEETEQYSMSSPVQGNTEATDHSRVHSEPQYQPLSHVAGQNTKNSGWEAQIRTAEEGPEQQEEWNANEIEEPLAWNSYQKHEERQEERRVMQDAHDRNFDQEYHHQDKSRENWDHERGGWALGHEENEPSTPLPGGVHPHQDDYPTTASIDLSRDAYNFPTQEEESELDAFEDKHISYDQDKYPAHGQSEEQRHTDGPGQYGDYDSNDIQHQQQEERQGKVYEDHKQEGLEANSSKDDQEEHSHAQSHRAFQQNVYQDPLSEWNQEVEENDNVEDFFGNLNKDSAESATGENHGNDTIETRDNEFPWESQSVSSQIQSQWPSLDQADLKDSNSYEPEGLSVVEPAQNVEESGWVANPEDQQHVEHETLNRDRNNSFRIPSSNPMNELLQAADVTSNQSNEGLEWPERTENGGQALPYITRNTEYTESISENNRHSVGGVVTESSGFDNEVGHVPSPAEQGIGLYVENADAADFNLPSSAHNASFSGDQKSKALELLDLDDDLLLDDDFLDEEPELSPVSSSLPEGAKANSAPKSSFANKYANPVATSRPSAQDTSQASAPRSLYVPPPVVNILPKKVDTQTKPGIASKVQKNDAYDFPVEFPQQRAKPASRAMSTNDNISKIPAKAVPGTSEINSQHPAGASAGISSEKKPFFEDLPVALPKPGNKPKRAAPAATIASPKLPSQSLGPPEPTKALPIKSPKNPYASLAPKVGLASQQQPQQQQHTVHVGSERSTPSKYQPSAVPMGRLSQKTPVPLPVKPGVIPPPSNVSMGNSHGMQQGRNPQGGFGVPPMNNQQIAQGNQFVPPPLASNAYSPVPQQPSQFPPVSVSIPHIGPGAVSANQYAPSPATGPGNQHAPSLGPVSGATNQYDPVQSAGQGHQYPPVPSNQYASGPVITNQLASGSQPNHYAPIPTNQYAPGPAPQPVTQPFPQMGTQQGLSANSQETMLPPVNRAPRVNTNLPKSTDKNTSLSPYVPDTGPYGPSARSHSRTSSLIGGNAKDSNPYAPASQGLNGMATSPNHTLVPGGAALSRKRGKSTTKPSLPTINQGVVKIENPEALLRRQFPVFSWGPSDQAVLFISSVGNSFEMPQRVMKVAKVSELLPRVEIYADFPGPLSKSKSKRKEIETWLEKNIEKLKQDYVNADELIINEILYALVQNDGDFVSASLQKRWAAILTPNVDFSVSQEVGTGFLPRSGPGLAANAFKLDNAGINTVWALVQAGNREGALQFATSKQDWALAFIVAQSFGPDVFSKVCSDYARITFPFQTNQNTRVQHLMPLLLKIFVGNTKGVIDDFVNVPSEAEFAKAHYREIVSAAIVNGSCTEFLVEFGNFLQNSGLSLASEICFMMAGIILSRVPLQNGAVFSTVGSFTSTSVYSEIYEYILSVSTISTVSIPPTGLPDLLPAKVRRAQLLADIGHFAASRRYCDHIGGVLKVLGKTPIVTPHMSADFKQLLVRLSDCSSSDSGWLGSKLSKVNLDKVWGQLDKFIGGDDITTKGEKVFSKFSPSVSRKSSMLDVTAAVNYRPENFAASSQITSAPPTEFSSPTQRQTRTLASQNFTPSHSQTMGSQPQAPGKPGKSGPQFGRYHPQNGSSSSVNLLESSGNYKNDTFTSNPTSSGPSVMNPRNQMYSNRAAQLSSSSIASQTLHSNGIRPAASPSRIMPSSAKPTESNEIHRSYAASSVKGHSRVSSIQDEPIDVSRSPLVNQYERKPSLQDSMNEERPIENAKINREGANGHTVDDESGHLEQPRRVSIKSRASEIDTLAATSESESKVEAVGLEIGKKQESEVQTTAEHKPGSEHEHEHEPKLESLHSETHSEVEPQTESTQAPTLPPPPPVAKLGGPKKVNPYAPSGSGKSNKGSNRYGPSAASAKTYSYKFEPKTSDETAEISSGAPSPIVDVFSDDKNGEDNDINEEKDVPQATEKTTEERNDAQQDSVVPPSTQSTLPPHNNRTFARPPRANFQRGPQTAGRRNPYAPAVKQVATNVDISFEAGAPDDAEELEAPREPLILNGQESSMSDYKPGFVNPYQEGKKSTDLPIQSGFDEFPIPGSPEYTTRANSVIGHTGLYSSRLSQSQQSALYQQYEVKDDTVHDYVPVPEEQEEEEVELKKKSEAAIKKDMEEAKRKISEEMSSKGGGQNAESGWFKGWLGNSKNDDKPKPIRAKLGKANTFKYDETHKRWIDTSRPLEEQLKESAPPPPPKKKVNTEKEQGEAPAIVTPAPMRGPSATPSTIGGRRASATKTPAKVAPGTGAGPEAPAPRPNLANAGLDDLLNMNSANKAAAARRGKRRYVNVMETK